MKTMETDTNALSFVHDLEKSFTFEYHIKNPLKVTVLLPQLLSQLREREVATLWFCYRNLFSEPNQEMKDWVTNLSRSSRGSYKDKAFRKLRCYILHPEVLKKKVETKEPDEIFLKTQISTGLCSEKLYKALDCFFDHRNQIIFSDICCRKKSDFDSHWKFNQKVLIELSELLREHHCSFEMNF